MAVGRHILETTYYILRDGTTYRELGANDHDEHDERRKESVTRAAIARLRRLGYEVKVKPVA